MVLVGERCPCLGFRRSIYPCWGAFGSPGTAQRLPTGTWAPAAASKDICTFHREAPPHWTPAVRGIMSITAWVHAAPGVAGLSRRLWGQRSRRGGENGREKRSVTRGKMKGGEPRNILSCLPVSWATPLTELGTPKYKGPRGSPWDSGRIQQEDASLRPSCGSDEVWRSVFIWLLDPPSHTFQVQAAQKEKLA